MTVFFIAYTKKWTTLHMLFLKYETQIGKKKYWTISIELQFTCKTYDKSEKNRNN